MITEQQAREQLQEWGLSDSLMQKICGFLQDESIGQFLWGHLVFFYSNEAYQLFAKQFSSPNPISKIDFFQAAANYFAVDYVANELFQYNKQAKKKLIADGQSPFSQFIFQLIHFAPNCSIIPSLQVMTIEHKSPFFLGKILMQLKEMGVERITVLAALINAHSFPEMFISLIRTYLSHLDANVPFTHMEKIALIKIIALFKSQYDVSAPDSSLGKNFEEMLDELVGNNRQLIILFLQNFLSFYEQYEKIVFEVKSCSIVVLDGNGYIDNFWEEVRRLLGFLKKATEQPNPEVVMFIWMKLYPGFVHEYSSFGLLDEIFEIFMSANNELFSLPVKSISALHCETAFALTQLENWRIQEERYGLQKEENIALIKKSVSSLIKEHREYATLIVLLAAQFYRVWRNELSEYAGNINRSVSIFNQLVSQFLQLLQALDRKVNINFISNNQDLLNQTKLNFEWLSLLFNVLAVCYLNQDEEGTEEKLASIFKPHIGEILKSILLDPGLRDVLSDKQTEKDFFTAMLEESSRDKGILAEYRYILDVYSDHQWLFHAFLMIITPSDTRNFLYPGVTNNIEALTGVIFAAEQQIKLQVYPLIFNSLGGLINAGVGESWQARYVNTCMRHAESMLVDHAMYLNNEQAENIKQFAKNLQQAIFHLKDALDESDAIGGAALVLQNPMVAKEVAIAYIETMKLRSRLQQGVVNEIIDVHLPVIAPAVKVFVVAKMMTSAGELVDPWVFINFCIQYCQKKGLTNTSSIESIEEVRVTLEAFSRLLVLFDKIVAAKEINEKTVSHAFDVFQPFFSVAMHEEQIWLACQESEAWTEAMEKILLDATAPSALFGKEMFGPCYNFWFFLHYPVYAAELANLLTILDKIGSPDSDYALLKEFLSNKDNQYMLPLVLEALKLSIASSEPINLVRVLSHPAQVIEQSRQASWMNVRSSIYHSSFFNSSEDEDRGKKVIEKVKERQWVCTNTANAFCFFSGSRNSSEIGASVIRRTVAFMHKISSVEAMIINQTLQQMSSLLASRSVADVSEVEGLAQQFHVLGS